MSMQYSGTSITFPDSSSQTTAATGFGFKNRIINGGMTVAQYGTSVAPTNANFTYSMDRFFCFLNSGTSGFTVSQLSQTNTGLSGFYNALRYQRNSGQTSTTTMGFGQTIETQNCQDLAGQSVTLSFWARAGANFSAASSQITARIATGSGVDQGSNGAYQGTWTSQVNTNTAITISTTWTKYTVTLSVPSGTNEIQVLFYWAGVGTAGASDYVDITGVQLEKGSTATSFDYRPYGTELALCQRYYETGDSELATYATNTSSIGSRTEFKVTKRATPTVAMTIVYAANVTQNGPYDLRVTGYFPSWFATTTGMVQGWSSYTASAEL